MRHATVLAALVLIFSADMAFAESDLTQELKAAAKLPPLEEMKAAAKDAWANYHNGETKDQLDALLKSAETDLDLLRSTLSPDERAKHADMLAMAEMGWGTLTAGPTAIHNLNTYDLLPWAYALTKGKPNFRDWRVKEAEWTLSRLEQIMDNNDCAYYGWELQKCKKFTDDQHQKWLAYDAELKDLILELIKKDPDNARQWTKVGDDLSLSTFIKQHELLKKNIGEARKVATALLNYAKANHLIISGESNTSR